MKKILLAASFLLASLTSCSNATLGSSLLPNTIYNTFPIQTTNAKKWIDTIDKIEEMSQCYIKDFRIINATVINELVYFGLVVCEKGYDFRDNIQK